MGLKAIFIDMGGTIETFRFTRQHRIENCHVIRDCLATKGISLPIDDEQLADMISKNISTYSRWSMTTNIELSSAEIWANYILKDFSISKETIEDIAENLAFLYEIRLYIREMRPEVPYVLQKIKDMGLTIGCISNTQSITQVPYSMKSYGIYDFFEHIILSSTYGRRKPDPAIFYYAARLANLPTGSCAYIGDKINRDILGSNRAGYSLAVQIRHQYDNGDIDEGATPDAVINSMDELIPILESRIEEKHSFALNTNKSGIRALLFDAGDILYFRPNKGAHFNKFLSEVSVDPVADIENELLKYRHLAFTGQIKRHAYYEKVIRLQGIHDPVLVEKGIKALSLDDNTVEIVSGVPETIRELKKRGFILGIITDTALPCSKKLLWFEQQGFGNVWDTIISSCELGMRKPHPSLYEKALTQTGATPNQALFIGHKISELDGAKKAGMRTIAFNYDEGANADFYIDKFADLLDLPVINSNNT